MNLLATKWGQEERGTVDSFDISPPGTKSSRPVVPRHDKEEQITRTEYKRGEREGRMT